MIQDPVGYPYVIVYRTCLVIFLLVWISKLEITVLSTISTAVDSGCQCEYIDFDRKLVVEQYGVH